ncbi:MAG: S41 family peptidase [Balneolaceae bacterium]|jgi:hypothetical protein
MHNSILLILSALFSSLSFFVHQPAQKAVGHCTQTSGIKPLPLKDTLEVATKLPDRTCDCHRAFEDLVRKMEENYIGYKKLRKSGGLVDYRRTKEKYKRITQALPAVKCTRALQQFLDQFEDGHLFVYEEPEYTLNEKKLLGWWSDENRKSGEYLNKKLQEKDNSGMIGKWTDGHYQIFIIREGDVFNAYSARDSDTLSQGTLLAQLIKTDKGYEGFLNNYDLEPRYVKANLYKEKTLLHLGGVHYWARMEDGPERELEMIDYSNILAPTITSLNEETTLFSIPSFLVDPEQMRDLLMSNVDKLTDSKNLIIDIRGNTGGNAIYFMFTDIYVTNDLLPSQGKVLASPATLKYYKRLAGNSRSPIYTPLIERIKKHLGEIVGGPAYQGKKANPYPSQIENVAILTDEACASAAESFILHSKKMSKKVTIFGSPTAGVIDYTSVNILKLDSGNQHIWFGYPTSTLPEIYYMDGSKGAYNKSGILPDVSIPDSVRDKVGFVLKYYD